MYSLMLMAAVAGGPDAAGFGWRTGSCTGCTGGYAVGCYGSCTGSCYGSCTGTAYSSCYGSCTGSSCSGGGLFSRMGGLFHRSSSCTGCTGTSCYGASYGSCYGSFYRSSCYGSAYGGCYGSSYGSCYGSCYGTMAASACCGVPACCGAPIASYGCTGCTGYIVPGATVVMPATPGTTMPAAPVTPAAPAPKPMTGGTEESAEATPASLTVKLPAADAKLFVDGALTGGDGAARKFHTPALPVGQAFFYDLTVEVVVNGKVETEQTRVVVRAGDAATATFPKLVAALAATRTEVAAK